MSDFAVKALDESTWPDFAALVERSNGVWGGCWCMGFHQEGVGRHKSPEQNRSEKEARVRAGHAHAALAFDGDRCVGWCQFGPPAELPNIKNRGTYDRGAGDPPDWRIGCVFTGSKHRREGVARAGLAAVLRAIGRAGGGTVEAYPEQLEGRGPQRGAYLHTGPEELFEQFGFVRDRRIAKWRWVMRTTV